MPDPGHRLPAPAPQSDWYRIPVLPVDTQSTTHDVPWHVADRCLGGLPPCDSHQDVKPGQRGTVLDFVRRVERTDEPLQIIMLPVRKVAARIRAEALRL